MTFMFDQADNFNQDISMWNVGAVQRMFGMFQNNNAFNQDLSGWDVSSLRDAERMFFSTFEGVPTAFNQDLCQWGTKLPDLSSSPEVFDRAFLGSSCVNPFTPDLTVDPPGPFCATCGSPPPAWNINYLQDSFQNIPCILDGNCIASHEEAGVSTLNGFQGCQFETALNGTLGNKVFDLVQSHTLIVTLPGDTPIQFKAGDDGPSNLPVPASTVVRFTTSVSGPSVGWRVCLDPN